MNGCREFRDLISAHLDGALDPAQAAALETHLATCADCARALKELRATVDLIRSLEPVEPPPWLAERILARVRAKSAALRPRPWATRAWVQAAALVVISFTGYLVVRHAGPSRAIPPPAEAPAPREPQAPLREAPAPRKEAPKPREKEIPAPRRTEPRELAAPPPPAAAPQGLMSSGAAMDRMENRTRKAEARAVAEVAFHLEGPGGGEKALEALRLCGGEVLQRSERSVTARLEGRRLATLRALLEKAGKVDGDLPAAPAAEVVVTISW